MTRCVYIASSEWQVSKSAVALGVLELFARQVRSVGFFRPLVQSLQEDGITTALLATDTLRHQSLEDSIGVSYEDWANDPDAAIDTIVAKYSALAERFEAIVIVGSDFDDLTYGTELDHNALIAANLNAPVLYVCRASERSIDEVCRMAEESIEAFEARHNTVVGIIATRAEPEISEELSSALREVRDVPVSVLSANPVLDAPSVGQHFEAVDATLWRGTPESLNREALTTIIAGMSLPNLLPRLQKEATVIVPADRLDLLPALIMAHRSATYGPLASLVLTGGFEIPETVAALLSDSEVDLPIGATNNDTFPTAVALREVSGEATELVREKAPDLKVEGPIQFDAAVDEVVAAKKMPGSEVAGRATVFIFPDLNTGNNTYKAVQRTSGAVAIGPVLQGLRKPVNDLSRGALVDDIVSTITITAIQAQTD